MIVPCPAIVSEDIWNECNRILEESEKKNRQPGPRAKHLLAGYVHCSNCESKMYVFHHTNSPTYRCKSCNTRIPVSDIEEIFHEQLRIFLLTDTTVSEYLETIDSNISEKRKLLDLLSEERGDIKKKMERIIELRIANEMSKEDFAEHYKPMESEESRLTTRYRNCRPTSTISKSSINPPMWCFQMQKIYMPGGILSI